MIKVDNISEYLREHDVKPSFQRLRIFEFLMNNHIHPTVDNIYQELVHEIPTLSKTTVYNTLKLFIEKGITQMINIEDNETRYDADTHPHGHFKCLACGHIYDFSLENTSINIPELTGFDKQQTHLYIKGICQTCNN